MKLSFLKSYLVGAGSTLEMFPSSDPDDDLVKIYQQAERWRERSDIPNVAIGALCGDRLAFDPSHVVIKKVRKELESYLRSDRDALADDWKSIGGDFLCAYEKSKKQLPKPRKDKSECWGS